MAYKIGDNCITCGVCEAECPEEAIYLGPSHFQVDPSKCKNCGNCANVCPVGAPQADDLITLNALKKSKIGNGY